MNKINVPSPSNGIKFFWEDLEYTLGHGAYDAGLLQGIESILLAFGENFIVSGCEDLGSSVTAAGWIMLGGNLIKVDQHTRTNNYFAATTNVNATGVRTDLLGGSVNIYQENRAECTAASGNLSYLGIRLNEILGLNVTTRTITTDGTYNIANNEKKIVITSSTSSATTVNLPTPSEYNKGQVYYFIISYTGSGTLNIVGESGNLKNYPGYAVSGVIGFINNGTTWVLACEKITATDDLPGIVKFANVLTDYITLNDTDVVMSPEDVGNAIKSDYVAYSTPGTYTPGAAVGVMKVTDGSVLINLPADSGKKQVIRIFADYVKSASPDGSKAYYSDDGFIWYEMVEFTDGAPYLYTFISDGSTWRWTVESYTEQT